MAADPHAHQALATTIAANDHRLAPINTGQGVAMLTATRSIDGRHQRRRAGETHQRKLTVVPKGLW